MDVPDIISQAVWEKARRAFAREENYVAYNNTLLFVHETDINFFTSMEEADEFCLDNISDYGNWNVVRIADLEAFQRHVESIIPGLAYTPKQEVSVVAEEQLSFFPKDKLLTNQKFIMTAENMEENFPRLKNKVFFLGFDESLYAQLEEKMKEGKPEFTLQTSKTFDKDEMEAVLHFRLSVKDDKETYFLNHYIATLKREDGDRSQFFYVNNKGQSITFKEARNLLNSRAVHKEITPREGAPYKAWQIIEHENIDQKTGYPRLRQFTEKYGFDLKEAINRLEFKGMKYDDQLRGLMKSLQKGNLAEAVLIKNGREIPVTLDANPRFRTLNMYDAAGVPMYYPSQKVEQKYGQAPADAKRELSTVNEPGVKYEKKDLIAKPARSNGLLKKNQPTRKTAAKKQTH